MKKIVLSFLKYLILPFALLYGFIVFLINKLYDWNVISSIEFNLPVICVGNITVGGTGKSPHIEYLIDLLAPFYKVATLSRGYRRHTTGFIIAHENTNAREIGDEPFQFKSKYPQITVAVAEERMTAIPLLLQNRPETEIVLLDDAFQHRTVRAGLNILLTDYDRNERKSLSFQNAPLTCHWKRRRPWQLKYSHFHSSNCIFRVSGIKTFIRLVPLFRISMPIPRWFWLPESPMRPRSSNIYKMILRTCFI
jgi:hypothetical protein